MGPPVDAQASTAPANWDEYPTLFIRGMVNVPVTMTFAAALPDTLPMSALDIMAVVVYIFVVAVVVS